MKNYSKEQEKVTRDIIKNLYLFAVNNWDENNKHNIYEEVGVLLHIYTGIENQNKNIEDNKNKIIEAITNIIKSDHREYKILIDKIKSKGSIEFENYKKEWDKICKILDEQIEDKEIQGKVNKK